MRHPHLRSAILVSFIVVICGLLGTLAGQRVASESLPEDVIGANLRRFTQVYDLVEQNYAEPVNPDKAIFHGAIPEMLHNLDPHSTFFDPKAYASLQEEQKGKYFGVGMTIASRGGKVIVIAPFVGSPAYRAGIRPGDVIVSVDSKPAESLTADEIADLVRGPAGSTVHIAVLREGSAEPIRFNLTRGEIPRYSVDVHFLIRPGIGYVHIDGFSETTDAELTRAMDSFGDLKGLLLDLRQDPGGLLDAAVNVADKFLPKGDVIVSQRGRSTPEKVYRAAHGNDGKDFPIVILVDRGTASAAEIVTGALQDHDRALVVGETTFGKGLVQTVYPLSDRTALALTTAKYYTPSGRSIQRNYSGVSLYDYYYGRDEDAASGRREVRLTDSGRRVYGGDGISPDVKVPAPKPDRLEDLLSAKFVFFNFAQQYLAHHPASKGFQANDEVMQEFRDYLRQKKIPYTEADLSKDSDWIKRRIETEIVTDSQGLQQGLQVSAEQDPEVLRALNLLPQAKQLADNARRVTASRAAAGNFDR